MSQKKKIKLLSKVEIQQMIKRYGNANPVLVIVAKMAKKYRSTVTKVRRENRKRLSEPLKCVLCGRCCMKYGNNLQASDEDIARWLKQGRDDILLWVGSLGDLWINRVTDKEAARCPWFRKIRGKKQYMCRIHDTKPRVCREYQVSPKQAVKDICPGLRKSANEPKTSR